LLNQTCDRENDSKYCKEKQGRRGKQACFYFLFRIVFNNPQEAIKNNQQIKWGSTEKNAGNIIKLDNWLLFCS
jgi:hypothetical protein